MLIFDINDRISFFGSLQTGNIVAHLLGINP